MAEKRTTYTMEEIKKLAPSYRGKAENFNPAKAGKKRESTTKANAQVKNEAQAAANFPHQQICKAHRHQSETNPL
ncbi:hypothetical protein QE152_g38602 [Popillia japonica]|uniref:Uncharacterized protein n=1 Tax=Popillia japonica TaxID=7064 RepID=A0AAW1HWC7_POPJA